MKFKWFVGIDVSKKTLDVTLFFKGNTANSMHTSNSQGRLFFNIMASLAEFEREVTRERTMAGLAAARERGRVGGRPKGLSPDMQKKAKAAKKLYQQGVLSTQDIAKTLGISRATLYRYLQYN